MGNFYRPHEARLALQQDCSLDFPRTEESQSVRTFSYHPSPTSFPEETCQQHKGNRDIFTLLPNVTVITLNVWPQTSELG